MPFTSLAQIRKFHADPRLRKYIKEFSAATPTTKGLPERVTPPKRPLDRLAHRLADKGRSGP